MAGTREDANMILELAKWGTMLGLSEASRKIYADDFDPHAAQPLDEEVQTLLVFYETIGTFVKNELLDRELVYDWTWVVGAWERVGPAALKAREHSGVPELFANFEALAQGQS
jgi:hypothetical protein